MTTKAAQKISLWEFFQQLGKTFMLPVALLSFCGIMLGIGSSLSSHDVITLIPFLGNPVLQAIFIWRLLSLLTKWLDVGLMCGNFCYVAAIRFVMCNELTSFRGNFMPHPCPITSPDNHQTPLNAHRWWCRWSARGKKNPSGGGFFIGCVFLGYDRFCRSES